MVSLSNEQQRQVWTNEAFMALSGEEKRYEVVQGFAVTHFLRQSML